MQLDLFENKIDRAIRRLRDNEPTEGYYGATSGGKDSICIMRLSEMAGVKVVWHYNVTTVDPPELVRFLKRNYPDTKFNHPKMTMWELIVKKRMPPTRVVRYCCEYLKEGGGNGRVVITGVRRAESSKRSNRQSVECFNSKKKKQMIVNPIIDWTNHDVWSFIKLEKLKYCSLYDEGFKRLGCVGCPMAGKVGMEKEFKRWPHFKKLYIKTFDKMLKNRLKDDLLIKWTSPEAVFDWWVNNQKNHDDKSQLKLFD